MEGEIMGEGEIVGGGEMPGGEVLGGGEILEQTRSLAAPFVFFIIIGFQFAAKRLQDLKRGASKTDKEMQLRAEIKQLLKEAASYSQPSTFAQAAKLRRMAAAKEKELANYQAHLTQEMKLSYDLYLKVLFIVKVIAHVVIILWFWSSPVAYVSQHLVQPFVCLNMLELTLSEANGGQTYITQNQRKLIGLQPSNFCREAVILEDWGFFRQQCPGWDYTMVDLMFQS